MALLQIFFITLLIIIAAGLALASLRPDTFRIERETTIKAPAEEIFARINTLGEWVKWSPFEKKDLDVKRTLSGPESGVGAVYEWAGNNKVGKGRMEIIESVVPSRIIIRLDFFAPFKANNTAEFLLTPKGNGTTHVVWAMYGPQPYIGKVMGLIINCDKMVGKDFAEGLANLKALSEKK